VGEVTLAVLAKMLCLASGIFGRPAWDDARCSEHAGYVMEAADRHGVDPVLMVAVNIFECDMGDKDNPIRRDGKLVGYDACPMGVRIIGVEHRQKYGPADLYELAAVRMERWKRWCERSHRGRHHHYIKHYNEGNPAYAPQILAVMAILKLRGARHGELLKDRTIEIVRRLARLFVRGWSEPQS